MSCEICFDWKKVFAAKQSRLMLNLVDSVMEQMMGVNH